MMERGVVERRDRDAVHLLHHRLGDTELALVLRCPHVHRLDGDVARAGGLPVPEPVGVGLADVVARDRFELGVDDHHRHVEVVADQVGAAQPDP